MVYSTSGFFSYEYRLLFFYIASKQMHKDALFHKHKKTCCKYSAFNLFL